VLRPRPAAAAKFSARERGDAVGLASILDQGQFSSWIQTVRAADRPSHPVSDLYVSVWSGPSHRKCSVSWSAPSRMCVRLRGSDFVSQGRVRFSGSPSSSRKHFLASAYICFHLPRLLNETRVKLLQ